MFSLIGSEIGLIRRVAPFRLFSIKNNFFEKYKWGSPERLKLEAALDYVYKNKIEVPMVTGFQKSPSCDVQCGFMPHNHQQAAIKFFYGNRQNVETGIKRSLEKKAMWQSISVAERVCIWRKAADYIEQHSLYELYAAIMLTQAKTILQAEEDVFRLLQSMRLNAEHLEQLATIKLSNDSSKSVFPSFHLRPLEGFVAAVGPATSTWTSVNLALCPLLMGNTVVWKPSNNCVYSSYLVLRALEKQGLPRGVLNFVPANPKVFIDAVMNSPDMAGLNFTGTLNTFIDIWEDMAFHIQKFHNLPRFVGQCGGKNFHFIHESANLSVAVKATLEGAFEFSGQHCNSCSRLYIPNSMWPEFSCLLSQEVCEIKIGDPCDFITYTSALINNAHFENTLGYLLYAQKSCDVELICGGDYCKTLGYYIEPTVLRCIDPLDRLMCQQICGPILSVYVYKNNDFEKTLELAANTTRYAYTGSIFAADDRVICTAIKKLRMAASNLYINEKCSGNLEGLQPFGGGRLSGTNDHPGTAYHLLRWTAPQLIEESFPCDSQGRDKQDKKDQPQIEKKKTQ